MLFEKDISMTLVSLVWESATYAKPDSQPLVDAIEGDVLKGVFGTSQSLYEVDVRFRSFATMHQRDLNMMLNSCTLSRLIQHQAHSTKPTDCTRSAFVATISEDDRAGELYLLRR